MTDDLTAQCRAVLLEQPDVIRHGSAQYIDVDDAAACMARALDRYHNGYPCDECIPGEGCGNINAALAAARGEEE